MAINIPKAVFDKYKEFADAMISDFGVTCKLVHLDQIQEISENVPRAKQKRSLSIQDRSDPTAFARGSKKFKTVETTEDITLRVYWGKKDWIKVGDIDVPDGSVQTIGYLSDITRINKAKSIIINSDNDGIKEYTFVKAAEAFPFGFKKDRYAVCFWKRS